MNLLQSVVEKFIDTSEKSKVELEKQFLEKTLKDDFGFKDLIIEVVDNSYIIHVNEGYVLLRNTPKILSGKKYNIKELIIESDPSFSLYPSASYLRIKVNNYSKKLEYSDSFIQLNANRSYNFIHFICNKSSLQTDPTERIHTLKNCTIESDNEIRLYSTKILNNNLFKANQLSIYFPKGISNYKNNNIECETLCIYLHAPTDSKTFEDARNNNQLKIDDLKPELQKFGFECKKLPTNLQLNFDKKQLTLTLKGNIYIAQ